MDTGTYNLEELSQHFALELLSPGNLKEGMKANGATSNDLWKFPVANLRPIEGFNVRVRNAKHAARVRRYADSMKAEGYWSHKPMAGYIGRDKSTGSEFFFMTAGYTRHEAVALANSELPKDKQIEFVTVVVHPAKTTTATKLNALLITENDSAALDPYEASIVCKRMFDDRNSVEEIALMVHFSTEWVESLLELAAAPLELQLMVVNDVIKPTFAIETIKEHGDQALAVLKAALARKTGGVAEPDNDAEADVDADGEEAPAKKKVRLTAKDLTSPEVRKFQNAIKREAPVMYSTLASVTSDPAFEGLAPATREMLLELVSKLKKHEVPSGAPDSRQNALFDEKAAAPVAAAGASADTAGA